MLSPVVAHGGSPPAPHEVWSSWNLDPVVLALLAVGWVGYHRRLGEPGRRGRAFDAGMIVLVVAVVSPLDAMADALASAHMVQHVLLMLVAAPLLILGLPRHGWLRVVPRPMRKQMGRWRRTIGLSPADLRRWRNPGAVWLLHVGAIWVWHAATLYEAALRNDLLHAAEHVAFLGTAMLFWHVVVALSATTTGFGVLFVFTMTLQSTILAALLTFARSPWYEAYAATTQAWGLTPLADQQLAGVIMWIPAGMVYLAAGLIVLTTSLHELDRRERPAVAEIA